MDALHAGGVGSVTDDPALVQFRSLVSGFLEFVFEAHVSVVYRVPVYIKLSCLVHLACQSPRRNSQVPIFVPEHADDVHRVGDSGIAYRIDSGILLPLDVVQQFVRQVPFQLHVEINQVEAGDD